MKAKTAGTIVAVITALFLILVTTNSGAEEVLPKKKPFTVELQTKINSVGTWINERPEVLSNWATNEWEETKEFQKKGWEQGKDQLARNFQQIKNFFVDKEQN